MKIVMSLVAVSLLAASVLCGADEPSKAKPKAEAKPKTDAKPEANAKPKLPLIKVARETTYLLEPLDAEGYVDYVAAVNQRASKEATVENNFEVVVRTVLGSSSIGESIRAEYFQKLGMKAPPVAGSYLQNFAKFYESKKPEEVAKLNEEYNLMMSQPWSAKDHPQGEKWLQASNKLLDQVVVGTRRTRFYVPYIGGDDKTAPRMIQVLLPSVQDQRELARILMCRAYLRIDGGDLDSAWSDVLAVHRQARLLSQGFTIIEELVGIALESLACAADAVILRSGKLTAEQGRRFLGDLEKLPPLGGMKDKIDQGERLMGLDAIQSLARTQGKSFAALLDSPQSDLSFLFKASFDWNATLELMNKEYDLMTDALDETDPQVSRTKLLAHKKRVADIVARNKEVTAQNWLGLLLSTKERGRKVGEILIGLLIPAIDAAITAEHRGQARLAVTRVGFAVELYRLEKGRYPDSLMDLTPKLLKTIPVDPFSQKPLTYRKDAASGFVVYSLGQNETDNDGKFRKDDKEPVEWDDLAVQGPPAK